MPIITTVASSDLNMNRRPKLFEKEEIIGEYLPPISTITFFEGDIGKGYEAVKKRFAEILEANPWLRGFPTWDVENSKKILRLDFSSYKVPPIEDFVIVDRSAKLDATMPLEELWGNIKKTGAFIPNVSTLVKNKGRVVRLTLCPGQY